MRPPLTQKNVRSIVITASLVQPIKEKDNLIENSLYILKLDDIGKYL